MRSEQLVWNESLLQVVPLASASVPPRRICGAPLAKEGDEHLQSALGADSAE